MQYFIEGCIKVALFISWALMIIAGGAFVVLITRLTAIYFGWIWGVIISLLILILLGGLINYLDNR